MTDTRYNSHLPYPLRKQAELTLHRKSRIRYTVTDMNGREHPVDETITDTACPTAGNDQKPAECLGSSIRPASAMYGF